MLALNLHLCNLYNVFWSRTQHGRPSFISDQMILSRGPTPTSTTRNLTRWDFKNLRLAGVRTPLNREFRRKHLQSHRCDERDSEKPEKRCANTTELVEEIRACAGPRLAHEASETPGKLNKRSKDSDLSPE